MMTQDTRSFTAHRLASIGVYLLISLIAVLIVLSLNVAYVGVADSDDYVVYARALLEGRYELAMSLRTYGYPLFIMVCITLGKLLALPFSTALLIGQMTVHLLTARGVVWIARKLHASLPQWAAWTIFAAVAWNPYLLAATTQSLTESFTAACFTLTLACIVAYRDAPSRGRLILIGALVGFCTLVRPYHLVWGVLFLMACALLWPRDRRRGVVRRLWRMLWPLALGFGVVLLTQVIIARLYPPPPDLTQRSVVDELFFHLVNGLYTYRYETAYDPSIPSVRAVYYYSDTLYQSLAHPLLLIMPLLKAISLFQQHDFAVYRTSFGSITPLAFATGLVLWCFFCTVIWHGVGEWRQKPRTEAPSLSLLLAVALVVYVGLYAFLTIPEPRYIIPVYPVLTGLAMVYALRTRRWRGLLIPLAFGVISYLLMAIVLLDSLNRANILPHLVS